MLVHSLVLDEKQIAAHIEASNVNVVKHLQMSCPSKEKCTFLHVPKNNIQIQMSDEIRSACTIQFTVTLEQMQIICLTLH